MSAMLEPEVELMMGFMVLVRTTILPPPAPLPPAPSLPLSDSEDFSSLGLVSRTFFLSVNEGMKLVSAPVIHLHRRHTHQPLHLHSRLKLQ